MATITSNVVSNIAKSRQVAGAVVVRGLGVFLQCLLQIVVARLAGPAGVSVLQLFQSWTCVSGEVAALGLPVQIMKQAAVLGQSAKTRELLLTCISTIVRVWLALFMGAIILRTMSFSWFQPAWSLVLLAAVASLCFALQRVLVDLLKALNQVGFGIFAETSILPMGTIVLCFIVWFSAPDSAFASVNIAYFAAVFLLITTCMCLAKCLWLLRTPKQAANWGDAKGDLLKPETAYFWISSILAIGFLNLPFFILPLFGSIEELGRFTIAFKLINPVTTILIMLSAFFAPSFSRASANNNKGALRQQLLRSQSVSLALYIPILLPVLIFREEILQIFGQSFAGAEFYIVVLALSQFINAATGLAGVLLNMVGKGQYEFYANIAMFTATAIGALAVGPHYGAQGVVVVYATGFACKNICSYLWAWQATNSPRETNLLEGKIA